MNNNYPQFLADFGDHVDTISHERDRDAMYERIGHGIEVERIRGLFSGHVKAKVVDFIAICFEMNRNPHDYLSDKQTQGENEMRYIFDKSKFLKDFGEHTDRIPHDKNDEFDALALRLGMSKHRASQVILGDADTTVFEFSAMCGEMGNDPCDYYVLIREATDK